MTDITTQRERRHVPHAELIPHRGLATATLILGFGIAANSLLGPFILEIIEYRFSTSLINQGIGLDAVALCAVFPVAILASIMMWRARHAGLVLAFIPSTFAIYMLPQYVIGPEYLRLSGNNEQFFLESAMAEPFEEDELHACIECHGYHDVAKTFDAMAGIGDDSLCMDCHDEGEEAYDAAQQIYGHLSGLVAVSDSAEAQRQHVARIGMDDVDIEYLLKDAHQSLIHARTLVHTFDPEKVSERTDEGTARAREALALSVVQIGEHRNRRIGFGLATLFITILAIGLYLKIREIEK